MCHLHVPNTQPTEWLPNALCVTCMFPTLNPLCVTCMFPTEWLPNALCVTCMFPTLNPQSDYLSHSITFMFPTNHMLLRSGIPYQVTYQLHEQLCITYIVATNHEESNHWIMLIILPSIWGHFYFILYTILIRWIRVPLITVWGQL